MHNLAQNPYLNYITYETLLVVAALVLGKYLKYELRSKASLVKQWRWIVVGMLLQLVGEVIYDVDNGSVDSDFVLHGLSGGIICLSLFYYLAQTFKTKFRSWRIELIAFFMFVSTFGVLNELMEFAMDSLGFGHFNASRLDTWRDLLANSLGSLFLWILLRTLWRRAASK